MRFGGYRIRLGEFALYLDGLTTIGDGKRLWFDFESSAKVTRFVIWPLRMFGWRFRL